MSSELVSSETISIYSRKILERVTKKTFFSKMIAIQKIKAQPFFGHYLKSKSGTLTIKFRRS